MLSKEETQMASSDEKMVNITNHLVNVNQNHTEISPHTCQNGYHQRDHS